MTQSSVKLGYWSAVLSLVLAVAWVVAAAIVGSSMPVRPWTNLNDFLRAAPPVFVIGFTFIQAMAFLLAPSWMVMLCCLHDWAPGDDKAFTRVALCCMVATVVLGSQMYFVHFNSMRLIFSGATVAGLDQFLEWNWDSATAATGTLGWTLFLGLAFIFVAPIFSRGRFEKALRYAFLATGICSIAGMAGSLLKNMMLVGVQMAGQALGALALAVLTILFFRRLGRSPG